MPIASGPLRHLRCGVLRQLWRLELLVSVLINLSSVYPFSPTTISYLRKRGSTQTNMALGDSEDIGDHVVQGGQAPARNMLPSTERVSGDQGTSSAKSCSNTPASESMIVGLQSSVPLSSGSPDNDEVPEDKDVRHIITNPTTNSPTLLPMNCPSLRTSRANSYDSRWSHIPVARWMQHPHEPTCHAATALSPHQIALAGHRQSGTIDLFWEYLGVPPRMFFSPREMEQVWLFTEHLYARKIKGFNDTEVDSEEYRATCKSFRENHQLCRADQPLRHQLAVVHLTPKERRDLGLEPVSYAATGVMSAGVFHPPSRQPWNSRKDVSHKLEKLYTVPYLRFQAPSIDDIFTDDSREIRIQCTLACRAERINENLTREERMACQFSFANQYRKQRTYTGRLAVRSFWSVDTRSSTQPAMQIQSHPLPETLFVDTSCRSQAPSTAMTAARSEIDSAQVGSTQVESSQNRQLTLYGPGDSSRRIASRSRLNDDLDGRAHLPLIESAVSQAIEGQDTMDQMLEKEIRFATRRIGTEWHTVAQKANLPPRDMFNQPFIPSPNDRMSKPMEEIVAMPEYNLLTRGEGDYCFWNRCSPATYLDTKERLFKFFHEICDFNSDGTTVESSYERWTRSQAQKIRGIDANKISRLYAYYKVMGLFKRSWLMTSDSSGV